MSERQNLTIDVVSDVVCPWCYVGLKRLDKAIAVVPEVNVAIHWRPYQLDGSIPDGGMDRKAYMLGKFGSEERLQEIHARIEPIGAAEGIAFDFDAITVSPNTLDAHRLLRWASSAGPGIQHGLKRGLMHLYFEAGMNIGDHQVLIEAARASGMDASVVEALLATDTDRDMVLAEIETARRMGVTGVPCFLLEGRFAVMGAQDTSVLADAIRQVAATKARGELDAKG